MELWITFVDKCREQVITFCDSLVVGIGGWGTESCNFSKKSCNFSMGKKGDIGERKGYRGKWERGVKVSHPTNFISFPLILFHVFHNPLSYRL